MSKKKFLLAAITTVLLLILYFFLRKGETDYNQITTNMKRGTFVAFVFSSGQLKSEKSESINIPEKLKDRNLRIWELTITHMVDEGTLVDSGDYVATLDHTAVEEQIKLALDEMDKTLSEFEDSKIDYNAEHQLIENSQTHNLMQFFNHAEIYHIQIVENKFHQVQILI